MAMILGEEQAPWEHADTAPHIIRHLGHLRPAVLSALNRDPAQRPTMHEFQMACHSVLNSTTDASDHMPK
jgi:hypothetical protein